MKYNKNNSENIQDLKPQSDAFSIHEILEIPLKRYFRPHTILHDVNEDRKMGDQQYAIKKALNHFDFSLNELKTVADVNEDHRDCNRTQVLSSKY